METRVVIYARVSTKGQDFERQLLELHEYANKMGYVIIKEYTEKISGAKKVAERQALSELLDFVDSSKVDKVLIYECSRLSRRAIDFLSVIEYLNDRRVSLYILQNGLETLLADGTINPIAQLVLGIIGQFNTMERSLIRARMESGYRTYRLNGGQVGRKVGYRKTNEAMRDQYAQEIKLLKKGLSMRQVRAITHTSMNTLQKLKKIFIDNNAA